MIPAVDRWNTEVKCPEFQRSAFRSTPVQRYALSRVGRLRSVENLLCGRDGPTGFRVRKLVQLIRCDLSRYTPSRSIPGMRPEQRGALPDAVGAAHGT